MGVSTCGKLHNINIFCINHLLEIVLLFSNVSTTPVVIKQFPVSDLYKIYAIYNWMNNIHKDIHYT